MEIVFIVRFIVEFKIAISVIHKINYSFKQIYSGKLTHSHLLVAMQLSEVTFRDDGAFFRAGLNDGLSQKRWTNGQTVDNRDFTVCMIRCVYRAELILGR